MRPILSILIPTVEGREWEFERLTTELFRQTSHDLPYMQDVTIQLAKLKDNKEITIGAKRQKLYEMATGEYSVQIDDDDNIAPDYIERVLKALSSKPDCVCYFEHVNYNGSTLVSCHSNDFADWGENFTDRQGQFYNYIRTPFFKDVIKTDICRQIPVPNIRYAEDIQWARALKKSGLIKSEVFINDFMYFYSYTNQTEAQMKERYGIK